MGDRRYAPNHVQLKVTDSSMNSELLETVLPAFERSTETRRKGSGLGSSQERYWRARRSGHAKLECAVITLPQAQELIYLELRGKPQRKSISQITDSTCPE